MFAPAVEDALAFASLRHAGQTRKAEDTPYFTHLVHVAMIVARAGGDDPAVVIALLHDVLEDTVKSADERTAVAAEIEDRWGADVARSVHTLTEPKRDDEGRPVPWRARKEAYLEQLSLGDRRAWMVSAADKLHNLETLLIALERDGEGVWRRFWSGPEDNRWFYDRVLATVTPRLGEEHVLIRALGAAVTRFAAHLEQA
ncbi:MAG: HD domain-containing protein [Myxococcota bacterium]